MTADMSAMSETSESTDGVAVPTEILETQFVDEPDERWRRCRTWEDLAALAVEHHVFEDPSVLPGAGWPTRLVGVPAEGQEALERGAQAGLLPLRVYAVAAEPEGESAQRAAVTFLAPLPAYNRLRRYLQASPLLVVCDPDTPDIPVTFEDGNITDTIRRTNDDLREAFLEEWYPLLSRDTYRHLSHARWVHVVDLDVNEPLRLWETLAELPVP